MRQDPEGIRPDQEGPFPLASAELWDPTSGAFESTGSLVLARHGHTSTALADGRALIVGGTMGSTPLADNTRIPTVAIRMNDIKVNVMIL